MLKCAIAKPRTDFPKTNLMIVATSRQDMARHYSYRIKRRNIYLLAKGAMSQNGPQIETEVRSSAFELTHTFHRPVLYLTALKVSRKRSLLVSLTHCFVAATAYKPLSSRTKGICASRVTLFFQSSLPYFFCSGAMAALNKFPYSQAPYRKVERVQFSILSPDEIVLILPASLLPRSKAPFM